MDECFSDTALDSLYNFAVRIRGGDLECGPSRRHPPAPLMTPSAGGVGRHRPSPPQGRLVAVTGGVGGGRESALGARDALAL